MSMDGIVIKKISDIHVGDVAYFSKTITEADVMMFAVLSGDYAAHHVNKDFAATTLFHSRIAHGMLTAGLIGTVMNKLCGDGCYTHSQEIKFKSAVLLNDTVTVQGTVAELFPEKNQVRIDVICHKQGAKKDDRPLIIASFIESLDIE